MFQARTERANKRTTSQSSNSTDDVKAPPEAEDLKAAPSSTKLSPKRVDVTLKKLSLKLETPAEKTTFKRPVRRSKTEVDTATDGETIQTKKSENLGSKKPENPQTQKRVGKKTKISENPVSLDMDVSVASIHYQLGSSTLVLTPNRPVDSVPKETVEKSAPPENVEEDSFQNLLKSVKEDLKKRKSSQEEVSNAKAKKQKGGDPIAKVEEEMELIHREETEKVGEGRRTCSTEPRSTAGTRSTAGPGGILDTLLR